MYFIDKNIKYEFKTIITNVCIVNTCTTLSVSKTLFNKALGIL